MKLGLVFLTVAIACTYAVDEKGTYDAKYDNIDLDQILGSERLLKNYINCLMDEGPCTPDAQKLKDTLPDSIANNCEMCTEKQREGSEKVMHYIIDYKPEEWDRLEVVYDPAGTYRSRYLESKTETESESTVEAKN